LRSALGGAHPDGHDLTSLNGTIDRSLEMLRDRGVEALLLLSEGEPLAEDFVADGRIARLGEWPNLRVVRIPIADHTFGPSWAQRHVHAAFDGALTRALWREAERRRDGRDVQPGAD